MTARSVGADRPRERLERVGPEGLADQELVALVLGLGVRARHVGEVARDVLDRAGGVAGLPRLTREEIQRIRGIGRVRAAQLVAAIELGRRCVVVRTPSRPAITSARSAADVLIPRFGTLAHEIFGVMVLDRRRRLAKLVLVSQGSADRTAAHPRDVFRAAVSAEASAVVVFHTHPSGDPSPSLDDLRLTKRLIMAGEVVGIPVLDHLIVGQAAYFSFQESGLIRSLPVGPDHSGIAGVAPERTRPHARGRGASNRRGA